MSVERAFVDTNVVVYLYDAHDPARQDAALALVTDLRRRNALVLSPQVLREFYVASTRKLGVSPAAALAAVRALGPVVTVTEDAPLVTRGVELAQTHQLSFWDGLIVAAAIRAGVTRLYSEDLGHGRSIEGVRVLDPFRSG